MAPQPYENTFANGLLLAFIHEQKLSSDLHVFLANVLNLISRYLLNNAMTVLVTMNTAFQDENANKNTRR